MLFRVSFVGEGEGEFVYGEGCRVGRTEETDPTRDKRMGRDIRPYTSVRTDGTRVEAEARGGREWEATARIDPLAAKPHKELPALGRAQAPSIWSPTL